MNKIFTIALILMLTQVMAQRPMSENSESFSVNKLALTTNSSPILETTLIELDVAYDIALAKQNYELASSILRDMGIAYYNFGYLNIAKDYVWKSKIIAEKYDLQEQNLQSTALLSKINLKRGDNRASIQFEEEYFELLKTVTPEKTTSEIVANSENEVAVPLNVENDASFPISVLFTALGLVGLLVVINYLPQKKNTSQVKEVVPEQKEVYDIDINLESLNLIDVLDEDYFDASQLQEASSSATIKPEVIAEPIKEEVVVKSTPQETKPKTRVTGNLLERKPEITLEEPVEVATKVEEIDLDVELQDNTEPVESIIPAPAVSYHPKKAQPISTAAVLEARGNKFREKTGFKKLPLWVSGIEHHIKSVNLTDGIRFDFNYTGDFSLIPENVHSVFTKFLKSYIDELAGSNNIQSVSAILVNSSIGLVIQLVAKPIHTREPVLSLKTQMLYKQSLNDSTSCQVVFSESENADLKTVLKYVEPSKELVS